MRTIKPYFKGAPFYNAFIRWDEKAGLQSGCDTLPMIDALEAQDKETGL